MLSYTKSVQVGSRTLYCWQHSPSKLRDTQSIISYLKEPNPSPVQPTIKGRIPVTIFTIIGASILLELPYYDLIGDTVIDSMHACWEGVTKQFLRLWFDTSNKEEPYYIVPAKKMVFESRLKNIKFPHDFSHPVRSYEKDGAFWKGLTQVFDCDLLLSAVELKNFALIIFPSIMSEFLAPVYFKHFMLFSLAMGTVTSRSISPEQLEEARANLLQFVEQAETLYSRVYNFVWLNSTNILKEVMSFNLHLMTHLCDCIQRFGPTWTHSNFPFESFNKELLGNCHGTRYYLEQIAASMQRARALDYLLGHLPESTHPTVLSTLSRMERNCNIPQVDR